MKLIYSIQKHWARKLHYDLRLEFEGKLKSWAIPKEPPRNPKEKRLAVQVDDHELSYAFFEGIIPEGMYGAGKVEVWDKGFHFPLEFDNKKIVTRIEGKKLKGVYFLIRFRDKNWLFFKK